MFILDESESVKIQLDIDIGIYAIENIYNVYEYDLMDCFSVMMGFVPPNYVISREAYFFSPY